MNQADEVLRELLAIRRAHVAKLERRRALVGFDSALELQLEEHRREIARVKARLRELGQPVDEQPLDGPLDSPGPPAPRHWRQRRADEERQAPAEPKGHTVWILGLLVVTLALAGLVAWALQSVLATATVFVFTLLTLGIVLPFVGLQDGRLSQARWFRSYVATLRRIPGLDDVLR